MQHSSKGQSKGMKKDKTFERDVELMFIAVLLLFGYTVINL